MVHGTDITSESSVKKLYEAVAKQFEVVDVLINDAVTVNNQNTGDIEPTQWWHDFVSHPSQ